MIGMSVAILVALVAFIGPGCRSEEANAPVRRASAATPARNAAAPTPAVAAPRAAASAPQVAPPPADANAPARPAPSPAEDAPSRREVRALIARVLADKLPDRQLTARDYDRLTDAVLRLRAANRAAQSGGEPTDAATLNTQHQAALAALTDIETITGVPPSELGELLAGDDSAAGAPAAAPGRAR
jgi:hypothetical protein